MTPELGHAGLWLAAAFSLLALSAERLRARADLALLAAGLLTLAAFAAMVASFATRDFSVAPVNDHAHRLRPTIDALAAWFATRGGGVFLGAAILAGLIPLLAWKRGWLAGCALLLLVLLTGTLMFDPFLRVAVTPVEGRGLGLPGRMPIVACGVFAATAVAALVPVALSRTRWSVRLAAVGVAVALVGLAGLAFEQRAVVALRPGETIRVADIELTLRDVKPSAGPDFTAIEAVATAGGDVLRPALRTSISRRADIPEAASISWPSGGLALRLVGKSADGWRIALRWRPLEWALWAGGTLLIAAGILALARLPRCAAAYPPGWRPLAFAVLLGLAGYASTGSPGIASRPAPPVLIDAVGPPAFAAARDELPALYGDAAAWTTIAAALERGGGTAGAVHVLLTGLDRSPDSADLWTALGNALSLHAEGSVPPAARLAYARAARLDPKSPAPRYNLGLAWMLAGDPGRAAAAWRALRADSPAGSPWLSALDRRLAAAQAMLAQVARNGRSRSSATAL